MVQRLFTGVPRVRAGPRNMNPLLAEEEDKERLTGFPCTAKWKELLPSEEQVTEPTMPGLPAPTVPQGEESMPKFNFNETFDHEPFTVKTTRTNTITLGKNRFPVIFELKNGFIMNSSFCSLLAQWIQ
jgi:hypothetical protein